MEQDADITTPMNAPLLRPATFPSSLGVFSLGGAVAVGLGDPISAPVCLGMADDGRDVAAAAREFRDKLKNIR